MNLNLNDPDIDINPADLRIETWRPNRGGFCTKPDNSCRITHVPTGVTATSVAATDRSIHAAKAAAMLELKIRLAQWKNQQSTQEGRMAAEVAAILLQQGFAVPAAVCAQVVAAIMTQQKGQIQDNARACAIPASPPRNPVLM